MECERKRKRYFISVWKFFFLLFVQFLTKGHIIFLQMSTSYWMYDRMVGVPPIVQHRPVYQGTLLSVRGLLYFKSKFIVSRKYSDVTMFLPTCQVCVCFFECDFPRIGCISHLHPPLFLS